MSFVNRLKCCLAAALLLSAALLRGAPPTPEELRTSFAAATREKYPKLFEFIHTDKEMEAASMEMMLKIAEAIK